MSVATLNKDPVVRSHHKAPDDLAEFESGIPDAPEHLTKKAKAHWKKLVKELDEAGVLCVADADALAMYCEDYVLWVSEKQNLAR